MVFIHTLLEFQSVQSSKIFWFILYEFYLDLLLPLGGGLEGDYKLAELNFRWGPNSMVGSEHTFDKQVSMIYH